MKTEKPLVPRSRAERCVTLAAALLVLFGGLTAVAAWHRASPPSEAPAAPSAAPTPAVPDGPLSGLTILVDPGHGGYDGGARARGSGVWEKEINLSVALALEKALTQRGAKVIMTRREDVDLTSEPRPANLTKKRQDMQARVDKAVQGGADLVISVHMNEYRSRSESGPQVFYRAGNEGGRLLAGCIQAALIAELQPARERVAMAGDYFILKLDVPSVLVECGFISNAQEERLLLDGDYQARLADAIANGITEFHHLSH